MLSSQAVLKILALGFVFNGKRSYLRDPWNVLDLCIVLVSLVSLLGDPHLKPLRVLRALRPLRLVARFSGMRVAIELLLKAMPRVMDVFVVFLLFGLAEEPGLARAWVRLVRAAAARGQPCCTRCLPWAFRSPAGAGPELGVGVQLETHPHKGAEVEAEAEAGPPAAGPGGAADETVEETQDTSICAGAGSDSPTGTPLTAQGAAAL